MKKAHRTARYTTARIDSLNFASSSILSFFIRNENYAVDKIDKTKKEDRQRWFTTFGKPVKNHSKYPWTELYIINSLYGDTIPVKLHNKDKKNYRLELAGIQNYNTKQTDFIRVYQDLEPTQTYALLKRIDIAIDSTTRIPGKAITELKKHRPYQNKVHNTTYYDKSKDKNGKIIQSSIKIRTYNKSKKENLSDKNEDIMRLEFQFPASFFQITKNEETKKLTIKDLDIAIKKMEKYIKRITSLNAKIDISFSKLLLENNTGKDTEDTEDTENTHTTDITTEAKLQNTSSVNNKSNKKDKASKPSLSKKTLDNSCTSCQKEITGLRQEINTLMSLCNKLLRTDSSNLKASHLSQKKLLSTKHAALYFDFDPSFFTKRKKKKIFIKNKHYLQRNSETFVRWKREALEDWFEDKDNDSCSDNDDSSIDKELNDLICRTI